MNTQLVYFAIASAMLAAWAVGRYTGRPAPDPLAQADENYRLRFSLWLKTLWGIESRLEHVYQLTPEYLVSREDVKAHPLDETVPVGLAAANVHVDPDHGLRTWVLHTFNIAELRVHEAHLVARKRGPRFPENQEAAFQRLLKDARFLRCITEAAFYARSENYDFLRPVLLACMERYPNYTPALLPGAPGLGQYFENGIVMCSACKHAKHGPMCSYSPRCYCELDCNVDFTEPHLFIGRADEGPCVGCNLPQVDFIHIPRTVGLDVVEGNQ